MSLDPERLEAAWRSSPATPADLDRAAGVLFETIDNLWSAMDGSEQTLVFLPADISAEDIRTRWQGSNDLLRTLLKAAIQQGYVLRLVLRQHTGMP